jgi:hypothetical protein
MSLEEVAMRGMDFGCGVVALSLLAAGCGTPPHSTRATERNLLLDPHEIIWVVPADGPPAPVSFDREIQNSACERARAVSSGPAGRATQKMTDWMMDHAPDGPEAAYMAPGLALVVPFAAMALGETTVRAVQGALTQVAPEDVEAAIPIFYQAVVATDTKREVSKLICDRISAVTGHPAILLESPREVQPGRPGAVLQVEILKTALHRISYFSEKLEFQTISYVKLARSPSGEPIASAIVPYSSGKEHAFRFEDWAANDACLLRQELQYASSTLAETSFRQLGAFVPGHLSLASTVHKVTGPRRPEPNTGQFEISNGR